MKYRTLLSLTLVLGAAISSAADFAADFSLTDNPNGAWSYGWMTPWSGAFDAYGSHDVSSGLRGWSDSAQGQPSFLSVFRADAGNIHGITMGANDVALHPGPNGQRSVARFTATTTGDFLVSARFDLVDAVDDGLVEDTDVNLSLNGVSQFSGALNGYGDARSYSMVHRLVAGDRLDFSVGYGASGLYFNDSTRLNATVNAVPEPASLAALALGLAALRPPAR